MTSQSITPVVFDPKQCDFCTAHTVTYAYPARGFIVQAGELLRHYIGPWGACESCHALIEAGRWNTLADRTSAYVPPGMSRELARLYRREMKRTTLALHRKFVERRTGPCVRLATGDGP